LAGASPVTAEDAHSRRWRRFREFELGHVRSTQTLPTRVSAKGWPSRTLRETDRRRRLSRGGWETSVARARTRSRVMALGRAAAAVLPLLLPRPAPAAPALLERVEFLAGAAPAVRIHVSADRPAHAQTLPPSGRSPHRIYVDLSGTRVGPSTPKIITGAGTVRRVRVGQFEPWTVRVVLDLERPLPFAFSSIGGILTVQLVTPLPPARVSRTVPRRPLADGRAG